MLIGHSYVKLTEKNRAALPKRFREELGEKAIVAKWYEECLVVVSEASWKGLLSKLTGKSEILTSPVRDTDRFILGSAFEISLDSQGRFVIPKILKEYAKLKDEVVFVGLGNRLEIWDVEAWRKREKFVQEHSAELVEKLAEEKAAVR